MPFFSTTTQLKSKSEPISWMVFTFVSFLIFFVISLSFFIFSDQSLRLDEAQSLWQTSHSLQKMLTIIAQDVHVPLYHIILHVWQIIFGNGVSSARLISLIFFIFMIPSVYFLAKRAYNISVGLFATLLISISPFLNWYGNEIRMYSLFALLTVINQYFFMSIWTSIKSEDGRISSKIWIGYGVTMILGIFAHYFFVFNILTQFIFFIFYFKIFPKNSIRNFIIIIYATIVVTTPWLYLVITQGSTSNSQPLLAKPTSIDLFNTFSQFIFGFQNNYINTILVSLWPLLVLFMFLSLRHDQKIAPQTVYFFLSIFLPILSVYIFSVSIRPIYLSRYLIMTLPSIYILISWLLSTYPKYLADILKSILVAVMVATLIIEVVSVNTPVKENYREAVSYLNLKVSPQDVIVVSAPFTIYPIEYYYKGPAEIDTLPIWNRNISGSIPGFSEADMPKQIETIKGSHQVLWLLLSYNQGFEEKIRYYFDTHFERVTYINFSPGLNLYAYKLRYDSKSISDILKPTNIINQPLTTSIKNK